MAMAINVSADMETLLCLKAAKDGTTVTDYLIRLVQNDLNVDLSEYASLEDYASAVAGIQAGLKDFEAGSSISFEDWSAREDARKETRRQQKQNTRTLEKVA